MSRMFYVRFRLRRLPTLPSWATRTPRALLIRPFICCAHISGVPYFPSVGCLLWARQDAQAFNQPLSFDTSSVTDMSRMLQVRFRLRLLPSTLPSWATHARHERC